MDVEQQQVIHGEPQEEHPPEYVAPDVDGLVRPPEYAEKYGNNLLLKTR